ncbi:MAG: HupE/UreJ family protein [Methylococcales bacterium]|nr:HupE/UreJ family protein [Methylococcales bacterium]
MNRLILSTLSALSNRERLLLVFGVVSVLGVILFNSVVASVDVAGWSSGFTHPLHGGDHFLTMLAVGIWAAQLRGKAIWLLPLTFVGVMSLGGLAGAAGLFIPSAELIILLSGLVFSVFIVRKIRFSSQTNVIIVAFFAFFHGFAHGQEISTSASLISYTLGFMVATLLLHGAGILIVRLLVMIFALFISHVAYAQSSISHLVAKATVHTTQANSTAEFFMVAHPAPPDNSQHRQWLYSGEDGGGYETIGWAEVRSPSIANDGLPCVSPSYGMSPPASYGHDFIRTVHSVCSDIAYATTTAWLLSPQLGVHFLTNGVGLTSPPAALLTDNTPHFCVTAIFCHAASYGNQVATTAPNFDLPNPQTLAIRFLTNGVGTTSPPVLPTFAVVISPDFHEFIFRNSTRFTRSTALSTSHPLFSSTSVFPQTRFTSRSPPFAFFSPTNRVGHPVLPIG